jgi:hypothetical protein
MAASILAMRAKLIALAKERVAIRQTYWRQGRRLARAKRPEAIREPMISDASDRGQLTETDAAMRSRGRKMEEAVTQFVADQSQKLAEVERKRDRLVQELIKAQSKTDRTHLKAPARTAAVVNFRSPATAPSKGGWPRSPATPPMNAMRPISAMRPMRPMPQSRRRAARPQPPLTQNLVYQATITLAQRDDIDGKEIGLATVEIKGRECRAIDYVLSPLREVVTRAGRER